MPFNPHDDVNETKPLSEEDDDFIEAAWVTPEIDRPQGSTRDGRYDSYFRGGCY